MSWQRCAQILGEIGGRWDLAILAALAARESRQPSDLRKAVSGQAGATCLSWKVMTERLRRLEDGGYVGRREMRQYPKQTQYWITPWGRSVLAEFAALGNWLAEHAPDGPARPGDAAARRPGEPETARSPQGEGSGGEAAAACSFPAGSCRR